MTAKSLTIPALVIPLSALAIVSCGSSASKTVPATTKAASTSSTASDTTQTGSPGSGKPLTRAELLAKADAICRRVNAKRASVTLNSLQQYSHQLPGLAAYEEASANELSKLTPPATLTADWHRIVEANRLLANTMIKLAGYASAKDIAGAQGLLVATTQVENQTTAIAHRDGFKDCATLS